MDLKSNITVRPDKIRLLNLLENIAEGKINIPVFQREFVWKKDQMKNLFDSISKGYPIGSLLFWQPDREYRSFPKVGPYIIDRPKLNYYVLDGFQRISTLFGVLSNPNNYLKNEYEVRDYLLYYNLYSKEFDFIRGRRNTIFQIPLYKILDTFEYLDFIQEIRSSDIDKNEQTYLINNAKEINKIFLDYHIPFVEINGGDIKSAVDIFSRTNSTGTEISEDFMLSALSYNDETGFLLSESITEFLVTLSDYNFENLKRDTVLNCISNSTGKIYFDVSIEDLLFPELEYFTNIVYAHIHSAVRFLYSRLHIIDVRLLPYPTQLIFISEFFRLNPNPNDNELERLERWFWITTYSNYFTLYSLSQQRTAYKIFCAFAKGEHNTGIYKAEDDYQFTTAKFPERINFTGVRPKALQLFYLKKVMPFEDLSIKNSVREFFIFAKQERRTGNLILRPSSEFDNTLFKSIEDFLIFSSDNELSRHFLDTNLMEYLTSGDALAFLSYREELIKHEERSFIESLGIKYVE